ncbi:MAG: hypothetical protein QOH12_3019 [Solirubrobacteraceae bacterium]|jgi:hypothetical protein|nr:hypothetical protein [Solirubrobacteraceae bacterium]
MLPDHRIVVIDVRPDDEALRARLLALHSYRSGRLVLPLTPRPSGKRDRLQALCDAFLAAMGKSNLLGGSQRNTREQFRDVAAWLLGEDVGCLVALDSHYVDAGCWTQLIDVAVEVGATLVIGCDRRALGRGHKELLKGHGIPWQDADDLLSTLGPSVPDAEDGDPGWPPVPEAHFTTFADDLRDLLAPEQRQRAEAEYAEAALRTHEWLDAQATLEGAALAGFLLELIAGVPWTTQATIRIQAAQAAVFLAGWTTEVNFEIFLASVEGAAPLLPETAARLRRYTRPALPAAAALSLLTRGSAEALVAIRLPDVAPDGSSVTVGRRRFEVPDFASSILRAQVWARALEGAPEDGPLFHDRRSSSPSEPAKHERLQRTLGQVTHSGGVRAVRHWSERTGRNAAATLRRLGVVVRPLWLDGNDPPEEDFSG